jgi:hypothetical protein
MENLFGSLLSTKASAKLSAGRYSLLCVQVAFTSSIH